MEEDQFGADQGKPEITDAVQLWRLMKTKAGLDLQYYDKQMLDSEDPDLNLYSLLGIKCDKPSVEENMQVAGVTLEHLLQVLLNAFHPYSMMINEICRFFAKYEIKYADQNIRMEFDFESLTEDMQFDLENFREIARNYHSIEVESSAYEIRLLQINQLNDIFPVKATGVIGNESANRWIESYEGAGNDAVFTFPNVETPETGHPDLDRNLAIILNIWRSFVRRCMAYGGTLTDLEEAANWPKDRVSIESDVNVLDDVKFLCQASLNHWAKFFLIRFFGTIEEIDELGEQERNFRFNKLSDQLGHFVSSLNRVAVTVSEEVLAEQLQDILNLPVWKFRYELYAAWVLAKIDQAFDGHNVMLHHANGKLSLPFKGTKIATMESKQGDFELWSELKSPLENPSSKKRKAAIQPDYRIFFSEDEDVPANHFAAVEVKQYRKSNKRNFTEAMDDYARGLPKADIFLVNYGPVKDNIVLQFPERCTYMGQIRPDNEGGGKFVKNLQKVLPLPKDPPPRLEEYLKHALHYLFLDCPFDEIYVDVSGSLNKEHYKRFLRAAVSPLLAGGRIKKLVAVDHSLKYGWEYPVETALDELTAMQFTGGTGFWDSIKGLGCIKLVITDKYGYNDCVRGNNLIGGCLVYDKHKVDFIPIIQDMWHYYNTAESPTD